MVLGTFDSAVASVVVCRRVPFAGDMDLSADLTARAATSGGEEPGRGSAVATEVCKGRGGEVGAGAVSVTPLGWLCNIHRILVK